MLGLKKLDFYIIRKFLGTYFYSILLLTVIIIIFDISEKIDDFIGKDAPLKAIVFDYYLNFIPYFVNMFSSLFTFIAVVYFTSRMASNTEIVAMLNAGISFWRILVPYLVSAIFLTVLSFALMNYVIPYTNRDLRAFEKRYIKNPFKSNEMNLHLQLEPGTYIYVENFNSIGNIGYRFSLEKFDSTGLKLKLKADMITWDSIQSRWHMTNYLTRKIQSNGETVYQGTETDTVMKFTPADFKVDIEDAKIMTYTQLNKFIEQEKMRGSTLTGQFNLEKYKRLTFPFANIVLTFIGVALSSRKVRGGIGMHLGMGIAIAFTFI
ncbi:MAG TPA: LptF/LptG family permease, partial [Bacteroidales bacterium]|nr:LptF/LptG family permease [Bacteroidales bacterium]